MTSRSLFLSIPEPGGTLRPVEIRLSEPTASDPAIGVLQATDGEAGINVPLTKDALNSLLATGLTVMRGAAR